MEGRQDVFETRDQAVDAASCGAYADPLFEVPFVCGGTSVTVWVFAEGPKAAARKALMQCVEPRRVQRDEMWRLTRERLSGFLRERQANLEGGDGSDES